MFFAGLGSSEVECNPKMNILFLDDLGGLFVFLLHFGQFFLLRLLSWSSEIEHNPKQTFDFLMT